MNLQDLGYNDKLEQIRIEQELQDFDMGRVVEVHRQRYVVMTEAGKFDADITGNLRNSATSREDYPSVGDWVALNASDPDFAIIHKILPRFSILKRQAAGQQGRVQVIATNIDYAFLVQAIDRDWNVNRLERYLTICHSSEVKPIILLTKIDLIEPEKVEEIVETISQRIKDVPVIPISNETSQGFEKLTEFIEHGKTYCMLGSSGVGKSTLLNNLSGKSIMKTDSISEKTKRGMHVTTHRELNVLDSGGIVIDNPGMREVGIADTTSGLETTFDEIMTFAANCHFSDCTHTHEKNCAVLEAVESGEIDRDTYENFIRLQKEKKHYSSTVSDRRKKGKNFSRAQKNYQKIVKPKRVK